MLTDILIVTDRQADDPEFPTSLRDSISHQQVGSISAALAYCKSSPPEVVLLDVDLLQSSGRNGYKQCISRFWQISSQLRFLILGGKTNFQFAAKVAEAASSSFLTIPVTLKQIRIAIQNVPNRQGDVPAGSYIAPDVKAGYTTMLKTRSDSMKRMLEKIALVSKTETTVLLTGETGTGKGVVARLLHNNSRRARETMLSVHCGAIPDSLIESELFGHEKGSFTGAIKTKKGKFELASRGTIFLDEIGTITAATQIKLLQVLQDRTYQPVGSHKTHTTDVRIIAASNSNLEGRAHRGDFRADLYYRLNVFPIEVPPLHQRKEDIELFVNFFVERFNLKQNKQVSGVTTEVMQALESYHWPGNVREFENLLQRAFILTNNEYLDRTVFPADLFKSHSFTSQAPQACPSQTLAEFRDKAINAAEKEYLCSVLSAHAGKINATSETAGVSRRQIHKLLTKHGIKKDDYKRRQGRS